MYKRRVYAFCLGIVGGREMAEEMATEIFLTLFRSIRRFETEREFVIAMDKVALRVAVRVRRHSREEEPLQETVCLSLAEEPQVA